MDFRIADTFTDALAKLSNKEQKSIKITLMDLQLDPTGNGLRLHKLNARDKHFWSVSANMDLRIIIHRDGNSTLVCYVDHHDDAYAWANNRKLEVHPSTGAAQLVEISEVSREVIVPIYINKRVEREITEGHRQPRKPLAIYADEFLLRYGVPETWLQQLKEATEDQLLNLIEHLPGEAVEALLDLAIGTIPPEPVQKENAPADPFEHPDALRRFRLIESREELEAALDAPWDKWTIFLHPSQRELVAKDYSGPARVSGSAGTGKTVVALHRAVHLVRANPEAIVLLTTFSDALANALRKSLNRLLQHEPVLGERITIQALDAVANRIFRARTQDAKMVDEQSQNELLLAAAEQTDHDFTIAFLKNEWHNVVNPWQLKTLKDYLDVKRIGRRTALPQSRREKAWPIFATVFAELEKQGWYTQASIFQALSDRYAHPKELSPYDYVVVDEAQDISVPQLRFLASLVGSKPNGLFFSGDLGQRIFQAPFSWSALGVSVRGRAATLRINYRTSHQIRSQADLLLSPEVADLDGNTETRNNTQSVFNGPVPTIKVFGTPEEEWNAVADWISTRIAAGVSPEEIAVFVRSAAELNRAHLAVEAADQTACELDEKLNTKINCVTISTMHLAKGLEFKAVAVMACDEDVIPSPERIENVLDMAQIEEVYETERHLLYVACTRARDFLWISCAGGASEFLGDLNG
ncbi:3'-5' exonuclease [Neolewinella lacunae]|uniref:DNA 3'-5' helicase n=1 Tax=Neolewinella lacunae TaxID=1517758 RepID=A0A923PMB0_9BACT|nr:UvrD-helicase domain-containing protein [Neolewinella lacunae]MBC6994306.1 UvrD-helicase domain-containing protein [Neolewinella lacunae]MDN3634937.1 3'-5' exonuclease [Neolewinella lacunae]